MKSISISTHSYIIIFILKYLYFKKYCSNFLDTDELKIVEEYCEFGNIQKYLEENRNHFIDQIMRNTNDLTVTELNNYFILKQNKYVLITPLTKL